MLSPLKKRMLGATLKALFSGRFFMAGGHLPPQGHTVPVDFCGVGVATNADPETDRAVIHALRELGVRQVRLDFTYGDLDNHVARFLEALLSDGFKVMLHLLQPFDAANRMPQEAAQTEWKQFVSDTLDRFGEQVEFIEICSTINRKRWAGYSLEGFLAAWRIGHDAVRQRGLTLAGPSITDFEPPWTAGILDILQNAGLLPDIHTDNLFAERATEPERWDHKILGPRLAPLARFNLVKKARLLQRLGAHAGVPRMMSPAAFWTLPRIERMLPDSEQKQADYLARYMVLCAASGALERACWGPLICHREGLVDDGDHAYPKLERITHYASVTGSRRDFRVRPAFRALAAFNSLIPGARYLGKLGSHKPSLNWPNAALEVHAFQTAEHLIHVTWTTNGDAAAMCDVYQSEDLALAEWLDRDGDKLSAAPDIASESPIYLRWPAERTITLLPQAGLLPGVRIHRHAASLNHYYLRDAHWHGMVLARNQPEANALFSALHPDHIGEPAANGGKLRLARNAIWTITDPRQSGHLLVVKKPVKHHLHKKVLDRLKPSKAVRSWSGAAELQRRGLGTANPVAWFEQRTKNNLTQNWYICNLAHQASALHRQLDSLRTQSPDTPSKNNITCCEQLGIFVKALHDKGVYFRDLSAGNVLINYEEEGFHFRLIDTARVRCYAKSIKMSHRISDLTRASHKMTAAEKQAFRMAYFQRASLDWPKSLKVREHLYLLKTTCKKWLRSKKLYRALKR